MLNVPYDWIRVARGCGKGAIIAGGALRDLVFNRLPPKDVDIFIPGLKEGIDSVTHDEYMEGFQVENRLIGEIQFQIIKHRFVDVHDILGQFDIGLCMIAYDPFEFRWVFTEQFVNDAVNKTLTIYRDWNFNYEKHLVSVLSKYSDFRVVKDIDGVEALFV